MDIILTDPPYGIDYHSQTNASILNDKAPFIWWLYDAYRILKPGGPGQGALLCFTRWDVQQVFADAMRIAGFTVKSEIVWNKVQHGMGDTKAQFAPTHENILFAVKKGFRFPGGRPNDVFTCNKLGSAQMIHPTEKPVGLLSSLIASVTAPGALVCDPFAGSGSALVAAKETGRTYFGVELDAMHYDNAWKRLEAAHEQGQEKKQGASPA